MPFMHWQFSRKARENFRLVTLIIIVATCINLSLDLVASALGHRTRAQAFETVVQAPFPEDVPDVSGSIVN